MIGEGTGGRGGRQCTYDHVWSKVAFLSSGLSFCAEGDSDTLLGTVWPPERDIWWPMDEGSGQHLGTGVTP